MILASESTAQICGIIVAAVVFVGCVLMAVWDSKREHHKETSEPAPLSNKEKRRIAKENAKNQERAFAIFVIVLAFALVGGYVINCSHSSYTPNKDFNEWTGEPRNKDPFGMLGGGH